MIACVGRSQRALANSVGSDPRSEPVVRDLMVRCTRSSSHTVAACCAAADVGSAFCHQSMSPLVRTSYRADFDWFWQGPTLSGVPADQALE